VGLRGEARGEGGQTRVRLNDNDDDDENDTDNTNDDTNSKMAHVLRRDVVASKHTYSQRTFPLILLILRKKKGKMGIEFLAGG
jgi:hypothetical protein